MTHEPSYSTNGQQTKIAISLNGNSAGVSNFLLEANKVETSYA